MTTLNKAWVDASLDQADNERAKISEKEREMYGLSSIRLRCLINNLCAGGKINYLEIGIYKGATLISSVFGNDCKAVGVDNFKYDDREPQKWAPEGFIWDNMKSQLEANINRYKLSPETKVTESINIVESDFEKVDWTKQPKFNVCLFDISPVNTNLYDEFFEKTINALTMESVVVFTNQSNSQHALELNNALIKHQDKFNIQFSEQRISSGTSDASKYYSGVRIIGFKKKSMIVKKPAVTSNTAAKSNTSSKT
tara:strand:+ start:1103 stop:1864 length:762 start_codon:yes stop_codon:yes gene_type:complete